MEKQKILDFIEQCKKYILKERKKQNWSNVLSLISATANVIYESNIYYFDDDLENSLKCVANHLDLPSNVNYHGDKDIVLYYDGFGLNNRGLVQIYLEALCKCKHVIYITLARMQDKLPDVKRILDNAKSEYFFLEGKSYIADIQQLNKLLLEKHPAHFFFYSTPGDVVGTVIMAAWEGVLTRYQINLTDHSFWLGAKFIDFCIEFRNYGANISAEYRKIPKEKLVKIPYYPIVRDIPFQGYPFPKQDEQKIVFSGGSLYKTNGEENKYYKIVDYILSHHSNVIFWYAGTKGSGDSIELEKIIKKYPCRAYWTEERKDLLQVMKHSDIYLNTYPMAGALMLQYAIKAGIIPLTLLFEDVSKEFLLNEDDLGTNFLTIDSMLHEIDRLLEDSEYAKSKNISQALISEEEFNHEIANLVNANRKSTRFEITYSEINTKKFQTVQLSNYTEKDLNRAVGSRHNEILFKYFPIKFLKGGIFKVLRKLQ